MNYQATAAVSLVAIGILFASNAFTMWLSRLYTNTRFMLISGIGGVLAIVVGFVWLFLQAHMASN